MEKELLLLGRKRVLVRLAIPELKEGGVAEPLAAKELDSLVELFSVAANRRRLQMMVVLGSREAVKFTDLLRVGVNPKLVRDCLTPLIEMGLVLHREGGDYRLSKRGEVVVPLLTSWSARLLKLGPEVA